MNITVQVTSPNHVDAISGNTVRVITCKKQEVLHAVRGNSTHKIIVDAPERTHVQFKATNGRIRVVSNSPTVPQIALQNTSEITFLPGEVIGITKDIGYVKALAGVERAIMVCTAKSAPKSILAHVSTGNCLVLLEDGITAEPGDWAYLSASQAGRITNISPDNNSQNLGRILGYSSKGLVIVQLQIDKDLAS
jgi:hypothetical protein